MRFIGFMFLCSFAFFARAEMRLDIVLEDIAQPWAVSSISEDKLLISQREGSLLLIDVSSDQAQKTIIEYIPDDLLTGGQGGILDVVPHPNYMLNNWIYISYSAGSNKDNYLMIQKITLDILAEQPSISAREDVFRVADSKETPVHYAGRLAFDNAGNLLVTSGDGFDYREDAQRLHSHLGKVLRMSDAGAALPDNPFYEGAQAPQSYVYSYGHRNAQGLVVLNDETIVVHEHGAAGGDEVNIIKAGVNYGWPVVTNGMDYIGSTISPFKDYPGMELPLVDWTPSIAPSSMIYYEGQKFADLKDKFLITSLKNQRLYVLDSSFNALPDMFADNGRRLRDIVSTAAGDIFILTDEENAVLYRLVN
ncbi:MAG: PQQ-dependent sugar dehydrogenase [Pseudomonadota bacterium]